MAKRKARRTTPRRRRSARKRRHNPGMPVVMVNPSGRSRRKRRNPSHARRRRRNPSRARRRRNPSTSWAAVLTSIGGGAAGGLLAFAGDAGIRRTKLSMTMGSVALGVGGFGTGIAAAFMSPALASGIGGGVAALLGRRIEEQIALGAVGDKSKTTSDAAAVMRGREAAMVARSMAQLGNNAPSFRRQVEAAGAHEAAGVRYVNGPLRLMGPRSWATTGSDAGVVVSAHNSRRA